MVEGLFGIVTGNGKVTTYFNGPIQSYTQSKIPEPKTRRQRSSNPDSFSGPKLKVARAKNHIRELEALCAEQRACQLHDIFPEIDPTTGEKVWRILVKGNLPPEISAIVGDAIHNLRTALDYLVCDLARVNGKEPHPNGGFPISANGKKSKVGSSNKIQGVSEAAERLIIRIKDCEQLNGPLFELNILDVFDKHNSIVTVATATLRIIARVQMPGVSVLPNGDIAFLAPGEPLMFDAGIPDQFRPVHPLVNGAEIYRSSAVFNEDLELFVAIAFGKMPVIDIEGKTVFETLVEYADLVERLIGIFERSCIKSET